MPSPRKLDLIPVELRQWLAEELTARGFADIVEVTEALNARLQDEGLELQVGKSAVGSFSKLLKNQREAFAMAETLLEDMDIERESDMHRVLMQMIATAAVQLMRTVSEENGHLDAKDLMSLGRMLKDLMHSAGIREKLREDERSRIAREVREAAAETASQAAHSAGMTEATVESIKAAILGVSK
ncbi:phage protein Gp27 family protein [Pseudoruegeria sp. HB172150]|uniref:phage protein Gp27 family protein n=1 Tax=Pseudoruegeria sp. HB172150 TaxID=2721164 RepID=UPI00155630C2|nr:phage protein Gp27 family protein [Pseudoruegeria sp. HB172150]